MLSRPAVEPIEKAPPAGRDRIASDSPELRLQSIEHFFGKAAGLAAVFTHKRRHCADQRSLRHPAFAMPSR